MQRVRDHTEGATLEASGTFLELALRPLPVLQGEIEGYAAAPLLLGRVQQKGYLFLEVSQPLIQLLEMVNPQIYVLSERAVFLDVQIDALLDFRSS